VCSNFDPNCTLGNSIRGCSGAFTNTAAVLPASTVALGCAAGPSDSFLVRYVVDADNTNVSAGGGITDCLGANIIADATTGAFIVENRFFVATKANGVPELHCRGNGATPTGSNLALVSQPIAENVESMSITYGLAASATTQAVTRFATAGELEATPSNWDQVISARICLLVRSANDNITSAPQSYADCTNTVVTATDRRLRSAFSTTVTIRARATGAI
jgi:type IV pilus assembly protein PilW